MVVSPAEAFPHGVKQQLLFCSPALLGLCPVEKGGCCPPLHWVSSALWFVAQPAFQRENRETQLLQKTSPETPQSSQHGGLKHPAFVPPPWEQISTPHKQKGSQSSKMCEEAKSGTVVGGWAVGPGGHLVASCSPWGQKDTAQIRHLYPLHPAWPPPTARSGLFLFSDFLLPSILDVGCY